MSSEFSIFARPKPKRRGRASQNRKAKLSFHLLVHLGRRSESHFSVPIGPGERQLCRLCLHRACGAQAGAQAGLAGAKFEWLLYSSPEGSILDFAFTNPADRSCSQKRWQLKLI